MSQAALLDVNVIVALLDSGHVLHRSALQWLEQEQCHGWVTCPITENGVIRVLSQPAYPNHRPASQVAERLSEACRHPSHQFWPNSVSLLQPERIRWDRLLGPRQITDAYLLALAVEHGGRFVSFDQRIPLALVPTARPEHLCVIKA